MSTVLYQKDNFIIFRAGHGVIVQNKNKEFEAGHSHLKSFKSAKDAIRFVKLKKIPKRVRGYYLMTLFRLSDDPVYREKIKQLIIVREQKGKKDNYYNPQKGRSN